MSEWISLDTPTGRIRAWRANPAIPPRGALVVVQEIFGVNGHIRDVCSSFAAHGYVAMAPAFFDHFEHDVQLQYDAEGVQHGKWLVDRLGFDRALQDVHSAATSLEEYGDVGVVGYCWGGTLAYLANTRLSLPAVSYYGARSVPFLSEPLAAPMMFHFGERDASIPAADIASHRAHHPDAELHVYPAGHGFNCNQRADYDQPSATLALERTLGFFGQALHSA
ncbi:dienelactone hydrolase family protein [Thermomonas sp.]|uniref:dienelactone hydrolase family protein n=1 Tax=Thermomonas sp. TaxID=1971895 RepID=UPI00248702B0|nr:dienelactone hydrolase family protein [Thermomonas sp.]MDI1253627.1 dienelactone hydrolase family protein [Thermomonas sp.]